MVVDGLTDTDGSTKLLTFPIPLSILIVVAPLTDQLRKAWVIVYCPTLARLLVKLLIVGTADHALHGTVNAASHIRMPSAFKIAAFQTPQGSAALD